MKQYAVSILLFLLATVLILKTPEFTFIKAPQEFWTLVNGENCMCGLVHEFDKMSSSERILFENF